MQDKILQDIGLSGNETKVYLALLEHGSATAGKISEKSGVHRTNVYDALERLLSKSLVKYILRKGIKVFSATDPEKVIELIRDKEREFSTILPELQLKYNLNKEKINAHIHRGISAIKGNLTNWIKKGQPILVYGVPKEVPDILGPWLIPHHKERIKKKIVMKHIYNEDAQDRISRLNSMEYTEAKYLPKEYNSPVSTEICGDEVSLIHWSKDPLIIHIEDSRIAAAYTRYFDLLWNIAKK